jgi:hypothetical protein
MSVAALKEEIVKLAAQSGTLKKDTEEALGKEIAALAEALEKANPTLDPTSRLDLFTGRWNLLYSTFNLERDTNLVKLSFGKLPAAPVTVGAIYQEVDPQTDHLYDNVVEFTDIGNRPGAKVMKGRYTVHDGHRLDVVFHHVFATPRDGRSLAAFREGLGLAPDATLSLAIEKTPPLHSSMIFLDEEMRINRGSYGGVYVLRKTAHAFTPSRALDPALLTAAA